MFYANQEIILNIPLCMVILLIDIIVVNHSNLNLDLKEKNNAGFGLSGFYAIYSDRVSLLL